MFLGAKLIKAWLSLICVRMMYLNNSIRFSLNLHLISWVLAIRVEVLNDQGFSLVVSTLILEVNSDLIWLNFLAVLLNHPRSAHVHFFHLNATIFKLVFVPVNFQNLIVWEKWVESSKLDLEGLPHVIDFNLIGNVTWPSDKSWGKPFINWSLTLVMKKSQICNSLNTIFLIGDFISLFLIHHHIFIRKIWGTGNKGSFRNPNVTICPLEWIFKIFISSKLREISDNIEIFSRNCNKFHFKDDCEILTQSCFHCWTFWTIVLNIKILGVSYGASHWRSIIAFPTIVWTICCVLLTIEIVISFVVASVVSTWALFLLHIF